MTVKLYLSEWRQHQGITISELAAITDLGIPALSRIDGGHQGWTSSQLEVLAEALKLDPVDLLKQPPK